MKMTELFLAELEREALGTRHVLERVPDGQGDWKPHERSMPLGYLANMIATMPSWVALIVNQDEFDMKPAGGRTQPQAKTSRELVEAHEKSLVEARRVLAATTDEHLLTPWRLLAGGHVVSETPRHVMIRDGVFNHLAHHRGQLTVYLRLNNKAVPAIYGPSADEGQAA